MSDGRATGFACAGRSFGGDGDCAALGAGSICGALALAGTGATASALAASARGAAGAAAIATEDELVPNLIASAPPTPRLTSTSSAVKASARERGRRGGVGVCVVGAPVTKLTGMLDEAVTEIPFANVRP